MHERHVRVLSVDNNKQNRYIPAVYKQDEPCWFTQALLWRLWFSSSSCLVVILTLAIKSSLLCPSNVLELHKSEGELIG